MNFRRNIFPPVIAAVTALCAAPRAQAAASDDAWKAFGAKDYKQAFTLGKPEADAGDKNAEYLMGQIYEYGLGAEKDQAAALDWYRKAAAQGSVGSERQLGWAYAYGRGVDKDPKQAVEWLQKSADGGNAAGMSGLGWCYKHGLGVAQDDGQAAAWFQRAADGGDALGRTNLAWYYWQGVGVRKDAQHAAELFQKAAEQGNDDAMNGLGWMYRDGDGVKKDAKLAMDWFQKAIDAKQNAEAMDGVGSLYADGIGVDKDDKKALEWFQKAADKGSKNGQYNLGRRYYDGRGVAQDYAQAEHWLEISAERGDRKAQNLLGVMNHKGLGLPQDDHKAFSLYLKSAEQHLPEAQNNLAYLYETGKGTDKDLTEAIKWYDRAAEQGNKKAQESLVRLHQSVPKTIASTAGREDAPAAGAGGAVTREEMMAMMEEFAKKAGQAPAPKPAAVVEQLHSDVDAPAYKEAEDPTRFALVIGVEKYQSLPSADFAERDAKAVRAHLLALGYPERNVILLLGAQATKTGIEKYLESWLPRNIKEDSKVFVYYSGHGAPDPDSKQAYLVPWDGDAKFLDTTGYPLKRLYEKLDALKAKQVMVAMDSCFSGAGGRSVLEKGTRPLINKVDTGASNLGKVVVLAAAGPDEITGTAAGQGHGLFTYYLLKSLNDGHGKSRAKDLFGAVLPEVQDAARRDNRDQTPQLMGSAAEQSIGAAQ
jgi:TPR repeat protein